MGEKDYDKVVEMGIRIGFKYWLGGGMGVRCRIGYLYTYIFFMLYRV